MPSPSYFPWSDLTEQSQGLSLLAAGLLSDYHGGEDLAQEAVLRALSAGQPPGPAEIRSGTAWLRTTVRRLAANEWRSRARRREREALVAQPEAVPSSEEVIARAELGRRLLDAVDRLPAEYARALRDHYVGGLSVLQIAERDDVSAHTVKSRLSRGKALLRDALERDRADMTESLSGPLSGHWSVALAPLALPALRARHVVAAKATTAPSLTSAVAFAALMKKIAVVAALLLVGIAGFALWIDPPSIEESTPGSPMGVVAVSAPQAPVSSPEETISSAIVDRSRQAAPTAQLPQGAISPVTQVKGQVVDAAGAPLAGVQVTWSGHVWVDRQRTLERAAECVTDESGRYSATLEYEPESTWEARFVGQPYYTIGSMVSASFEYADLPVLAPGVIEVPVTGLSPAGAARGRVVDGQGKPVAGGFVRVAPGKLGSSYGLMPEADTQTEVDGTFFLQHAPLGTLGVAISKDGMTTAFLDAVAFEHERTAELGDIPMEASLHVTGQVVDGDGQAIHDQKVTARSEEREATYTHATTDAEGRFDLVLKSNVSQQLAVSRDGYESIGAHGFEGLTVAPGTTDLRLQLRALPELKLRVVDRDGLPIESFLPKVLLHCGSQSPISRSSNGGNRRDRSHPGGLAYLFGRPGVDLIRVRASGYLPFEGDVALDPGSVDEQTVILSPGAEVRGRVFVGDEPMAGVTVTSTVSKWSWVYTEASAVTNDDGEYCLRGLSAGVAKIATASPDQTLTAAVEVPIEEGQFVASGAAPRIAAPDLFLEGLGSIEGDVLLPPGVSPLGLQAYVGDWGDADLLPLDADGSFRIPDVNPGKQEVSLTSRIGEVDDVPAVEVEVQAGQVSIVQIDATQHGVAQVSLTIDAAGYEPEQLGVEIKHGLLNDGRAHERSTHRLAKADENGLIVLSTRASGIAHLQLHLPGAPYIGMVLMEPELQLSHGAKLDLDVTVHLGRIEVELPDDLEIDPEGYASLQLLMPGTTKPLVRFGLTLDENNQSRFATPISNGACVLEPVQVGRMELRLQVRRSTGKLQYERSVPVTVQPDATVSVRFPSASSLPQAGSK